MECKVIIRLDLLQSFVLMFAKHIIHLWDKKTSKDFYMSMKKHQRVIFEGKKHSELIAVY